MNILVINGSPKGKLSNTYKILKALTRGMQKTNANFEIINLSEHKINFCNGCMTCWNTTPGKCIIMDDMEKLLNKIVVADLLIYGTPLYACSMSGLLKTFIDRTIPLAVMKHSVGKTSLISRYSKKRQKIFLVSSCSFPDIKQFKPLVDTFKCLAKIGGEKYIGEILRTTANINDEEKLEKFAELLISAGKQLIEFNKIETQLKDKLQAPWLSTEKFQKLMNKNFR